MASASPDGTGLPAAASNPAARRHAAPAAVAAVSVAGTDAEADPTKAAPVLADHRPCTSSLRKRLVLRNNNKGRSHAGWQSLRAKGREARFASAQVHPPLARATTVTRLTQAHAAVTPSPCRPVATLRRFGKANPGLCELPVGSGEARPPRFAAGLKRDDFSSIVITLQRYCLSMIFSENRYPPRIKCGAGFFGIML